MNRPTSSPLPFQYMDAQLGLKPGSFRDALDLTKQKPLPVRYWRGRKVKQEITERTEGAA